MNYLINQLLSNNVNEYLIIQLLYNRHTNYHLIIQLLCKRACVLIQALCNKINK